MTAVARAKSASGRPASRGGGGSTPPALDHGASRSRRLGAHVFDLAAAIEGRIP